MEAEVGDGHTQVSGFISERDSAGALTSTSVWPLARSSSAWAFRLILRLMPLRRTTVARCTCPGPMHIVRQGLHYLELRGRRHGPPALCGISKVGWASIWRAHCLANCLAQS